MRRAGAAGLLALAAALAYACGTGAPDDRGYSTRVQAERTAKDEHLARDGSPVPVERRAQVLPLRYYPIDPSYAVPAALHEVPAVSRARVEMPTSTGDRRLLERVGVLEFTLQGQAFRLTAFVETGAADDRLFVPFKDATSGVETYAAGRYLEIERTASGIYVVDFNRAFNPYCDYNPTYDCPYPPRENHLPVAIRAGERTR